MSERIKESRMKTCRQRQLSESFAVAPRTLVAHLSLDWPALQRNTQRDMGAGASTGVTTAPAVTEEALIAAAEAATADELVAVLKKMPADTQARLAGASSGRSHNRHRPRRAAILSGRAGRWRAQRDQHGHGWSLPRQLARRR